MDDVEPAAWTRGLSALLDALAAPGPGPAGGSAAAAAGAMAAGLVSLVGTVSRGWADGPGVAVEADALRERLLGLAEADVRAWTAVLRAPADADARARNHAVPLEIAAAAGAVAALAARAEASCAPHVRPDAGTAALLARAAQTAAERIADANAPR